jgi:hypothetical protein
MLIAGPLQLQRNLVEAVGRCCATRRFRPGNRGGRREEPLSKEFTGTLQPGNPAGQGSGSADRGLSTNCGVGDRQAPTPDVRQRSGQSIDFKLFVMRATLASPGKSRSDDRAAETYE